MFQKIDTVHLYVRETTGWSLSVFGTNDSTTLCDLFALNGRPLMPTTYMLKFLPCSIAEPTLTNPCTEELD